MFEVSHDHVQVPGEQAHDVLLERITSIYAASHQEGKRIATGMESRSIISATKNVAGRAVQLIADIIARVKEKVADIIDGGEVKARAIEDALKEWADLYAKGIAGDQVHDIVEGEVLDGLKQAGVKKVVCITEDDERVCPRCLANKEQGAIPIGTPFLSGQKHSPFHDRCRCNVGPG